MAEGSAGVSQTESALAEELLAPSQGVLLEYSPLWL